MTNVIEVHPDSPQKRLIRQIVSVLKRDGVIVYPTDSGYALGGVVGEKSVVDRICRIRQFKKKHLFTLMCRDLSDISVYARVDNPVYRLLKAHTPGSYTFILPATKTLPKLLKHPKRKTIGVRISSNVVTQLILEELDAPMITASLIMPDEEYAPADAVEVEDALTGKVDLIVDGGDCPIVPTTVIDLTVSEPIILREGAGDISPFVWP